MSVKWEMKRSRLVAATLAAAVAGPLVVAAGVAHADDGCAVVYLWEHNNRSGAMDTKLLCPNDPSAVLSPYLYRKVSSWENTRYGSWPDTKVCLYDGGTYLAYRLEGDFENLPAYANDRATSVALC